MEHVIEQLKSGTFNMAAAGKTVSDEEANRLRRELEEADKIIIELQTDNRKLKEEVDKVSSY